MCEKTKCMRRGIDPCMREFVEKFNLMIKPNYKTVGTCCGHGRYKMTILVKIRHMDIIFEMFSGKIIPRKKRFYRRDKEGYYYIPEVSEPKNKKSP